MALITCNYYSEVLGLSTSLTAILPQQTLTQIGMSNKSSGTKHKTLYLLHGLSDDHTIWLRRTSVERYVAELGIAVIMPQVHRSFYSDMVHGGAYWSFLTEELPAIARSFFPLSAAREDNFVAGLSMGGYGAFKWALSNPECFAAAGSLSGVLDIVKYSKENVDDAKKRTLELVFGDEPLAGTTHDLLHLLDTTSGNGQSKPALYQCCGTEDYLYDHNASFRVACADKPDYCLTYEEGPGDHNWAYWDQQIQSFLKWLKLS
ncbi:alpha/beta hydrolase [Paenibacillus chungangensis]|uniref:Alpha/beta hydrolase n=1 Tax=Paenibacillus chungangensis TaxID=696535 RepID=A0ABW3HM43_9BACL